METFKKYKIFNRRLKPFVELYPFFDGRDISTYTTPKLLEIEMLNGQFEVGEDITLVSESSQEDFLEQL